LRDQLDCRKQGNNESALVTAFFLFDGERRLCLPSRSLPCLYKARSSIAKLRRRLDSLMEGAPRVYYRALRGVLHSPLKPENGLDRQVEKKNADD
jgi:hypothetical protein